MVSSVLPVLHKMIIPDCHCDIFFSYLGSEVSRGALSLKSVEVGEFDEQTNASQNSTRQTAELRMGTHFAL